MEIKPHELTDLAQLVNRAAGETYSQIGALHGFAAGEVYIKPRCFDIAPDLNDRLHERPYRFDSHVYKYAEGDIVLHAFLRAHAYGDEIVIDPAWQQFREGAPDPDNKVLVVPMRRLAATLRTLHVPRKYRKYWLKAQPVRR